MWFMGGGNGKPFQYSSREKPHKHYVKAKRYDTGRWTLLCQKVPNIPLGKSGGQLLTAPERMKQAKAEIMLLWIMSGGKGKIWCCQEQYCIGAWNVRSMNQGKLHVVKQKMARVNINILEINELKWMGKGKFNSGDHYIYYCGQEFFRRNRVALIITKGVQNALLGCSLKMTEWSQFISKANHSTS